MGGCLRRGPGRPFAFRLAFPHATDDNSLETILALIQQMEATLLGLNQLRNYVGTGVGQRMLQLLIEEAEMKLAEVKRKLIQ